jgi:DNA excision repair protein ERCC-6
MSFADLAAIGANLEEERDLRSNVEAAVEVDADPRSLADAHRVRDAEVALQRLEDEYATVCDKFGDAAAGSDEKLALSKRKATLLQLVQSSSKSVSMLKKEVKANRAERLAHVMATRDAAERREQQLRQQQQGGIADGGVAASAIHVSNASAPRLLNGALSAGHSTLVSARRAQRMLMNQFDASHVAPARYGGAATTAETGRRTASSLQTQPTEALLDYRGGHEVLESALRVTVDRSAVRKSRAAVTDDGAEGRFEARQLEHEQRKHARAESRKDDAASGRVARAHRTETRDTARPAGPLIDEDDDDDPNYLARLAAEAMETADAEAGDEQLQGAIDVDESSSASSEEDEPDVAVLGEITVPARVWVNLLDYQQLGLKWLVERHLRGAGGILGDEMGLGKTIQVAALLSALHNSNRLKGPVLILAPLTVLQQWVAELRKWAPALRVVVLHSSGSATKSRDALMRELARKPVVVMSTYTTATIEVEGIGAMEPQYIILDEGHKISNPEASTTIAVKTFTTPHRLILSGSPIQNTLKELWCLFDFVAPGALGTMSTFVSEFEDPIKASRNPSATPMHIQTAIECARALRDHIAPFMLRRLKRDVNTMLPPKHEKVVRCTLTDSQLQEYLNVLGSAEVQDFKRRVSRLRDEVGQVDRNGRMWGGGIQSHRSFGRSGMTDGLARQAFRALTDLRSITNHTDLFRVKADHRAEGGQTGYVSFRSNRDVDLEGSGKLKALDVLLTRWKEHGHRVLIFSQTRTCLDIIENLLEQRTHTYFRMDGTTPSHHRQHLIDRFNKDPSIFCALLTTRVGGLGVNLVGADRVVIFDPDWNPVTDEQARERAWRIGQTREVCIYRMVTSGTIEEHILHRQLAKLYVAEKVLSDPTLQRSFHLASMAEAFLLGREYATRVSAESRRLVSTETFYVANEVKHGQATFDEHGNTIKDEDESKHKGEDLDDEKSMLKTVHFAPDGVFQSRAGPNRGTTSRLEALEGTGGGANPSLSAHRADEVLPGGIKIESMPDTQSHAAMIKREQSSQAMPAAASAHNATAAADPNAETTMLQTLIHEGGEIDDATDRSSLAARLAQVVAHRTLHRATTVVPTITRRPTTAGSSQRSMGTSQRSHGVSG